MATHAELNGLSETQVSVLRAAADGRLLRSGRAGSLYRTYATGNVLAFNERTVDKLVRLDLMRIGERVGADRKWDVTEQGETALRLARKRELRRVERTNRRIERARAVRG